MANRESITPCIEVYKSNIRSRQQARKLVQLIETAYPGYRANVDLHDCDRILRICTSGVEVDRAGLQEMLARYRVIISELPG